MGAGQAPLRAFPNNVIGVVARSISQRALERRAEGGFGCIADRLRNDRDRIARVQHAVGRYIIGAEPTMPLNRSAKLVRDREAFGDFLPLIDPCVMFIATVHPRLALGKRPCDDRSNTMR